MAARRCAATGCGRFVRQGSVFCTRHAPGDGNGVGEQGSALSAPGFTGDELGEEFRRRVETGEYRQLFNDRLNEVIRQAAEERGLADEIGILRVVLARILFEERDPATLAQSVSRVVAVAIQAARAQRAISGEQAGSLTDALTQILTDLDTGTAARGR
jgi:hypothetical protein